MEALLVQQPDNFQPVGHKGVGRYGDAQGNPRVAQPTQMLHDPAEHPVPRHALVSVFACAVQRHLYARGGVLPEERDHIFVHGHAVGQHAGFHAHVRKVQIQLAEAGIGQAFAARHPGVHHARVHRLAHDILPCVHAQKRRAMHLVFVEMHIAHFAIQITQRGQLEGAGNRHILFSGLEAHEAAHRVVAPVIRNALGVQLRQQLPQRFGLSCVVQGNHLLHPSFRRIRPASARPFHQQRRRGRPAIQIRPMHRAGRLSSRMVFPPRSN